MPDAQERVRDQPDDGRRPSDAKVVQPSRLGGNRCTFVESQSPRIRIIGIPPQAVGKYHGRTAGKRQPKETFHYGQPPPIVIAGVGGGGGLTITIKVILPGHQI